MSRFSEVTGNHKHGKDVVTDEIVDISQPVVIPPRGVYILELKD